MDDAEDRCEMVEEAKRSETRDFERIFANPMAVRDVKRSSRKVYRLPTLSACENCLLKKRSTAIMGLRESHRACLVRRSV